MNYADLNDLRKWLDEEELIQLTDDNNLGAVDTGVVDTALEYASGLIDGYLGTRYSLPLTIAPSILSLYCADLAICALFDRRETGRPESWQKRGANAERFLNLVASGKISLGVEDPEGTGASDKLEVFSPEQLFPHSELDKY